jgi:3'(2'), 5'-bisphosphate nucleotidase
MTVRTSHVQLHRSAPVTVSPDALIRLAHLAVAAGHAALQHYHSSVPVERKGEQSAVTAAARVSHAIIAEGLHHWDPTIPVVSEGADIPGSPERADWVRFWLVDPLDGTEEFIQPNAEFTVNIALIERGEPVLGVIYAPALDLLYYAGRGLGSWKRQGAGGPERIVSRPPQLPHGLRVAECRSHPSPELEAWLRTMPVSARVPAGSSLTFSQVAEGKADIYPRFEPTMEWDVAAGDCIFRNSGERAQRRSELVYNQPELRHQGFVIGLADRELEAASGEGMVLWFTGLSDSGKGTLARQVLERLRARGRAAEYLDGDSIRDVFPAAGLTRPERDQHIRRVGWVASRLERHGITVLASLVSPYRDSRDFVRGLCHRFVEIWVSTPLEECARRDAKGLYARAKAGEIRNFTGLDEPYEAPERPELVIDTTGIGVEEAVERVLGYVEGLGKG